MFVQQGTSPVDTRMSAGAVWLLVILLIFSSFSAVSPAVWMFFTRTEIVCTVEPVGSVEVELRSAGLDWTGLDWTGLEFFLLNALVPLVYG